MPRGPRKIPVRDKSGVEISRKVLFILFMDIKGYSGLSDTHLKSFIENILPNMKEIVEKFKNEHINTWGDAIIVASADVRDIVQLALLLRDFFRTFDWERHNLSPLDARFSLHQGAIWSGVDLFTNRELIAGRTVNLAARIEPIVAPGQIWATRDFVLALEREKLSIAKASRIGDKDLPKNAGTEELYHIYRPSDPDPNLKIQTVSICIVQKDDQILLVNRIDTPPLGWQFPASFVKSSMPAEAQAAYGVLDETGITCVVERKIAERVHPDTGVFCHYFFARWTGGEAINKDTNENDAVEWVSPSEALQRFKTDIQPDVKALLEGMKE